VWGNQRFRCELNRKNRNSSAKGLLTTVNPIRRVGSVCSAGMRHPDHRVFFPRAGCVRCACAVRGAGGVKKTRDRRAGRKMKKGPSEPPCRRRLQNCHKLLRPKDHGGERYGLKAWPGSRHGWIGETSVSHPLVKASKSNSDEHQQGNVGMIWSSPFSVSPVAKHQKICTSQGSTI